MFTAGISFLDLFKPSPEALEKTEFLIIIIIVLAAVKIAGDLSVRFGQPSVFGKLLVGIIVGPSVLGLVHETAMLKELAEIGVLMLMFIAGVETDVEEFLRSAKGAFLAAVLGVLVPLAVGYWIAIVFGYDWARALFVGTILVATSVSISVQTLRELGRLQSREGFTILGAAVIDDILGLICLSIVLGIEMGQGGGFAGVAMIAVKVVLFFALGIAVGLTVVPRILNFASKMGITVPVLTAGIIIALAYAIAAEYMGMAGIVGAYLCGLMISMTKHKMDIFEGAEQVGYSFFIPFFFVSIGVAADVRGMTGDMILFTVVVTLLAVLAKIIGCGAGAMFSGMDLKSSSIVGIGMVARGEVALIVAKIGLDGGLISEALFTAMVVVAIVTTVVTPPLLRWVLSGEAKADLKKA
ncbi:MAG: cation:proton antiporter [Clostridia bacterium]|nr:cation:proton antiporter [Clostridia bacterium]